MIWLIFSLLGGYSALTLMWFHQRNVILELQGKLKNHDAEVQSVIRVSGEIRRVFPGMSMRMSMTDGMWILVDSKGIRIPDGAGDDALALIEQRMKAEEDAGHQDA